MNNSPLRYPGGKYKMFKYIKLLIEENKCNTYIEPFCGGAAVALELLRTGIVKNIIINDYDKSIYLLWKMILDKPEELIQKMMDTPITIEEWYRQKKVRMSPQNYSDICVAFSTLFLNRTNRSGIIDKAGPIGGKNQSGKYKLDCRFNKEKLAKKIRLIHSMRENIVLYNLDAIDFLESVIVKTPNAFTYFDPPYYNKGSELYADFLNHQSHLELAHSITTHLADNNWIITYDNSEEIKKMYEKTLYKNYSLQYSLQDKKKAVELIIYAPRLKLPSDNDLYINYI